MTEERSLPYLQSELLDTLLERRQNVAHLSKLLGLRVVHRLEPHLIRAVHVGACAQENLHCAYVPCAGVNRAAQEGRSAREKGAKVRLGTLLGLIGL